MIVLYSTDVDQIVYKRFLFPTFYACNLSNHVDLNHERPSISLCLTTSH
jgi:hypothetical protein